MTTYQVKHTPGVGHEILELAPQGAMCDENTTTLLVYYYEGGDIDTRMRNAEMMQSALYDRYQCHNGIKEGDRFETEYGNFVCVSFHVVPE